MSTYKVRHQILYSDFILKNTHPLRSWPFIPRNDWTTTWNFALKGNSKAWNNGQVSNNIRNNSPWRLDGSGVASGFMLQNSKASPRLGFTDKPVFAHSDSSFQKGTELLFTLADGNTVSPPASTSELPRHKNSLIFQSIARPHFFQIGRKLECWTTVGMLTDTLAMSQFADHHFAYWIGHGSSHSEVHTSVQPHNEEFGFLPLALQEWQLYKHVK